MTHPVDTATDIARPLYPFTETRNLRNTIVPLYLRARGIYSLGTVRANRIPGCKLPIDGEINKEERGFCVEYVTSIHGVDVNTVLWKDNKCVRLASTDVEMISTNSYILYKRSHDEKANDPDNASNKEQVLKLLNFREEIAAGLVSFKNKRSVGLPPAENLEEPLSPQIGISGIRKRAVHPVADVRFDGIDHFPI
ncbi:hypothetical protein QE152_g22768 [Popillia japonica]|uniref:Uncharacterized protein n=1 Tax=Popillia japonica TaxID=7064 RepID=A0AAW1KK26_POPJA